MGSLSRALLSMIAVSVMLFIPIKLTGCSLNPGGVDDHEPLEEFLKKSPSVAEEKTEAEQKPAPVIEQIGEIENEAVEEISGLVASAYSPELLWAHNDSGDAPRLYGLSRRGQLKVVYTWLNAKAQDWEDMTQFVYEGKSFLVMGDIGDNRAKYPIRNLYIGSEPEFIPQESNESKIVEGKITTLIQVNYRYEDGPRDAESLVVDLATERILILSKREAIPRLYSIALPKLKLQALTRTTTSESNTEATKPVMLGYPKEPVIARRIGDLVHQPELTRRYRRPVDWGMAGAPTAMALSQDGLRLVILSYMCIYVYDRTEDEEWGEAFKREPWVYRYPKMKQAEALTLDGRDHVIICSEGKSTPVYRIRIQGNTIE